MRKNIYTVILMFVFVCFLSTVCYAEEYEAETEFVCR